MAIKLISTYSEETTGSSGNLYALAIGDYFAIKPSTADASASLKFYMTNPYTWEYINLTSLLGSSAACVSASGSMGIGSPSAGSGCLYIPYTSGSSCRLALFNDLGTSIATKIAASNWFSVFNTSGACLFGVNTAVNELYCMSSSSTVTVYSYATTATAPTCAHVISGFTDLVSGNFPAVMMGKDGYIYILDWSGFMYSLYRGWTIATPSFSWPTYCTDSTVRKYDLSSAGAFTPPSGLGISDQSVYFYNYASAAPSSSVNRYSVYDKVEHLIVNAEPVVAGQTSDGTVVAFTAAGNPVANVTIELYPIEVESASGSVVGEHLVENAIAGQKTAVTDYFGPDSAVSATLALSAGSASGAGCSAAMTSGTDYTYNQYTGVVTFTGSGLTAGYYVDADYDYDAGAYGVLAAGMTITPTSDSTNSDGKITFSADTSASLAGTTIGMRAVAVQ